MNCFAAAPGTTLLVADATPSKDMLLRAVPVIGWTHVQGNQAFPMVHTAVEIGENRRTAVRHPDGTVTDTSPAGVFPSVAAWLDAIAGKSFSATSDGQAALARLKAAGLIDTTPPASAKPATTRPTASAAPPAPAPTPAPAPAPTPAPAAAPAPAPAVDQTGEPRRGRGRPPGSKNRPKLDESDLALI